jgi:hypothetical protein
MRIVDEENDKLIDSILIMLTEKEAEELSRKISSLKPEEGDHIHVNDLKFKRQITVLIYNQKNLHFYSESIRKVIADEDL